MSKTIPQDVVRVFQHWLDRVVIDIDLLEEGAIVSQNWLDLKPPLL